MSDRISVQQRFEDQFDQIFYHTLLFSTLKLPLKLIISNDISLDVAHLSRKLIVSSDNFCFPPDRLTSLFGPVILGRSLPTCILCKTWV